MPLRRSVALMAAATLFIGDSSPSFDRDFVYRRLLGQWAGSLTYKDYQRPDRLVTLPTLLDAKFEKDPTAIRLVFTYDDGPGKTIYSHNRFAFDSGGTALAWDDTAAVNPESFTITEYRLDSASGFIYLVAETEGEDDHAPATLKKAFAIGSDSLRIVKTVRPKGGEFGFRNEYVFRRVR